MPRISRLGCGIVMDSITLVIAGLSAASALGLGFTVLRKKPALPPASLEKKSLQKVTKGNEPKDTLVLPNQTASVRGPRELESLREGLSASRKGFMGRLLGLLSGKTEISEALLSDLEEVLLTSDVGPAATALLLERMKIRLNKRGGEPEANAVSNALKEEALALLDLKSAGPLQLQAKPTVVLIVGVNGVGKTTTIGKLATHLGAAGKRVMLGAADTFRAAAVQQLEVWGTRVGATVVKGKEGADPGSVAFEAATQALKESVDVLFIDTAGRLHNKAPLMDEIRKVKKTLGKACEGAPHEVLLVVDATTGQNALNQALLFKEAVDLTGIVLTKLDGTAKGGIVLAIADALKVPVRYIGLGERAEDLREFVAADFVEALFAQDADRDAKAQP
jgi:fused signal recognition particle receptor